MPLRRLFSYLANNERLVQKLAESYPIRRAAQLAVSLYYKGKIKLSDVEAEKVNKLMSFYKRFAQNIRQELEEAKKKK